MNRPSRPRAFVLIAVLIIVASAIFIATTVGFLVSGEVAGAANEREATKLRAVAWSGVQAVAAKLGAQRSLVLAGGTPLIDAELTLWEVPGEVASIRLLPVAFDGERLVSENGKIPLRNASVESLVATGAVEPSLAGRIIALRDASGGRLSSCDALLTTRGGADGLSAEELFGPMDDLITSMAAAQSDDPRQQRDARLDRLVQGDAPPKAMRDLLTTFAYEPALDNSGARRIRLDGEWTDDRRGGVDAVFGAGSSKLLEAAMSKGEPSLLAAFAVWRSLHADPKEWHAFLSSVTLGDGPIADRIDIQRASSTALRSLPGISGEIADRIVRERETLPTESRRSAAWLVEQSMLDGDAFAGIVDRVTTRSFLWRVRVEARIVPAANDRPTDAIDDIRTVVYEAVIDLSDERPRIASLRDLSGLGMVAQLLRADGIRAAKDPSELSTEEERSEFDIAEPSDPEPELSESLQPEPDSPTAVEEQPTGEGATAASRRGIGRWRRAE